VLLKFANLNVLISSTLTGGTAASAAAGCKECITFVRKYDHNLVSCRFTRFGFLQRPPTV
jgi:hypothetical protein